LFSVSLFSFSFHISIASFFFFFLSLSPSLSLSLFTKHSTVWTYHLSRICVDVDPKKKKRNRKKQTNKTQNQISDAHYIVTAVESKYFVLLYIFLQKSFVINSRHNFLFSFAHATFDSPSLNCDGFHLFSLVFCCVCVCVCVCLFLRGFSLIYYYFFFLSFSFSFSRLRLHLNEQ